MINPVDVTIWKNTQIRFEAHSDVNIIVGDNGSGKTTLLESLYALVGDKGNNKNVIYIPSVDNIVKKDNRSKLNALTQELEFNIYDLKTGPSFMGYRMKMIDASDQQKKVITSRVQKLQAAIENFLMKSVSFEDSKMVFVSNNQVLPIAALSSGEKQILLLLLRVFLLEERPSVILIDEPENSLDIEWQYMLIDALVKLNPNAQYFITTHSPSIFGNGWGDRVIYMNKVTNRL